MPRLYIISDPSCTEQLTNGQRCIKILPAGFGNSRLDLSNISLACFARVVSCRRNNSRSFEPCGRLVGKADMHVHVTRDPRVMAF